ncbi:acyl-CoA dehydrogenase [Pseudomaricurvus alkylphenolicus]|jgi:alkylation response protein AidB-like acyl-CoA dehydrogenase|uniref:acyl-CoA dehydrogenase family protein n=1 Tax=Pseudomaricurvus alkylphenolicus TaxID=1306991 RepID=UPI001420A1B9|nr:acyl-CoA dehydrogenase family protein [Pseudomaricurvus alkylphenolicus]NIB38798.1 acyl-CoA dehydrogenase [Pseudomaricurvus alkylphenolicus]
MLPRSIFSEEHDIFRESVRRFIEQEITPYHDEWEKQGQVSRELWLKAGEAGLLCPNVSEEFGGLGADFMYNVVITEELARAGATGPGFAVHSDMAATYIDTFASVELKDRWLPKLISGDCIAALGLTEPGAGSDLKEIRTTAVRDGDDYVINGQKVYISNGQLCDLVVLACKTDPSAGAKGMSFILVESDREGFERGRNLEKLGLKAQDTSELFFNNVRVPASNLIGNEGDAFKMAMFKLAQERITIAISALAVVEAALEWTVDYTKDRKAFGNRICDFQNTRFKMAELSAEATAMRVFVDHCIEQHMHGKLDGITAAKAKMLCTELQCKTVDECLQFFGGYGYMLEYPIAKAYIDARVRRIAGGSSEIMREIIGRDMFKD